MCLGIMQYCYSQNRIFVEFGMNPIEEQIYKPTYYQDFRLGMSHVKEKYCIGYGFEFIRNRLWQGGIISSSTYAKGVELHNTSNNFGIFGEFSHNIWKKLKINGLVSAGYRKSKVEYFYWVTNLHDKLHDRNFLDTQEWTDYLEDNLYFTVSAGGSYDVQVSREIIISPFLNYMYYRNLFKSKVDYTEGSFIPKDEYGNIHVPGISDYRSAANINFGIKLSYLY